MTDKELIKQCKNEKGQRHLYELYYPALSRLCYRYLKDESDTYDVLTSGFLKIFKNIRKFVHQGEGSLEAWMRKIIVNESLMHLRKSKKLLNTMSLSHGIDIGENSLMESDTSYLYDAIRNLPDGARTVFNMYEIEGYSHKEIAKKTGIVESASRSQLAHAKRKLREVLSKHFK